MSDRLKFAIYRAGACGGCDAAVLNLQEKILELAMKADILLWPGLVDGKYADLEALPDAALDLCFFCGTVRDTESERMARLLRAKAKHLIACGACAGIGGVPGLANQFGREPVLSRVFESAESTAAANPGKVRPRLKTKTTEGELLLPDVYERVFPLDELVAVDYYLPGCPPRGSAVAAVIDAALSNTLPPPKTVYAGDRALCSECPRSRGAGARVQQIRQPHELMPIAGVCLMEQGVICSGPVTRSGCGAACPAVNMPCRGCYGSVPGITDQGAKLMNAVAALAAAATPEAAAAVVAAVPDPIGIFYQFGYPKSAIKGNVAAIYTGVEKRKAPRVRGSFFVTYHVLEESANETVSESKSLSLGGMLLTTNKAFDVNAKLALEMSLPTDPNPIVLIGRVVESVEVVKDLIYDTRIEFMAVDDTHRSLIGETVNQAGRMA